MCDICCRIHGCHTLAGCSDVCSHADPGIRLDCSQVNHHYIMIIVQLNTQTTLLTHWTKSYQNKWSGNIGLTCRIVDIVSGVVMFISLSLLYLGVSRRCQALVMCHICLVVTTILGNWVWFIHLLWVRDQTARQVTLTIMMP